MMSQPFPITQQHNGWLVSWPGFRNISRVENKQKLADLIFDSIGAEEVRFGIRLVDGRTEFLHIRSVDWAAAHLGSHLDDLLDRYDITGVLFDSEQLATELQNRAVEALERREAAAREERRGLGVEDDVAAIEGLTEAMLVVLGKKGIKTLDDLGDLATDELVGRSGLLKEFSLSDDDGNRIIMAARAHWFAEEDASADGNQ